MDKSIVFEPNPHYFEELGAFDGIELHIDFDVVRDRLNGGLTYKITGIGKMIFDLNGALVRSSAVALKDLPAFTQAQVCLRLEKICADSETAFEFEERADSDSFQAKLDMDRGK